MGYSNGNGEMKMSAMQMTIFGIVFLLIAICAQEFLTKISQPILNWSDCSKENDMSIIVRGTTIPYAISVIFLLFPRALRIIDKWKHRRNGNGNGR